MGDPDWSGSYLAWDVKGGGVWGRSGFCSASWLSAIIAEDVELKRLRALGAGNWDDEKMFASESIIFSSTGVIRSSSSSSPFRVVIWYKDAGGSVPKTLFAS